MRWNEGDVWTVELDLPSEPIEFKCVRVAGDHIEWDPAHNRHLQINGAQDGSCSVLFKWDVSEFQTTSQQASEQHPHHSNGQAPDPSTADRSFKLDVPQTSHAAPGGSAVNGSLGSSNHNMDDRPSHLQWKGRETTFMSKNSHSRERQGKWDTSGLEGPSMSLVAGDEKAASWLSKMQLVKTILVDQAGRIADLDALSNVFIYLQWITSGAIECKEGGGHYRPNKHAELAREIFKVMERTIGDPAADSSVKLLARKVQTKLPSFTAEFTQSTPLTRIRDIAHRNDIPHHLKSEIKHTIQNKLHRNAGPEDLVATETMLNRIRSEGSYNAEFVSEFEKFRDELRDFFNAATFTTMLDSLRPSLDDAEIEVLDKYISAKQDADTPDNGSNALPRLVTALHTLTTLRACLLGRLSSGLRNDASDNSLAQRQRFRLAEIRAEDVAFVLISRIINAVEVKEGEDTLTGKSEKAWDLPLGAMLLSVRQIGLGGWQQQECMAIENELGTWHQAAGFTGRLAALRLKATLDRIHRLGQGFTDSLLSHLADSSAKLGGALGLPQEAVDVFAESEIRASLVFQASKLCTQLIKAARTNAGEEGWDILVAGAASGRLLQVQRIDAEVLENLNDPTVLLVKSASGDEEVAGSGSHLQGVILAQELPHLSHLGIRARQEGITFVTCEDDELIACLVSDTKGKFIQLKATSSGVHYKTSTSPIKSERSQSKNLSPAQTSSESLEIKGSCGAVGLSQASVGSCGAKAGACAQLEKIARQKGYQTPSGFCLPFGNMEHALKEAGKLSEFQEKVGDLENAELQSGKLDKLCSELAQMIETCSIPQAQQLGDFAAKNAVLIARSSANVEDLAGMSAAGLYDSIGGVESNDLEQLRKAVTQVWASLYTRRAVLARRAAGVPQKLAQMAVLIQEQLKPDYSFVLHSEDPFDKTANAVYAEIAPGLGETLASGIRGSPWRLRVDKDSGEVTVLAYANFSSALRSHDAYSSGASDKMYRQHVMDYSKHKISCSTEALEQFGVKLKDLGRSLQEFFVAPQDIEGCNVGDDLFVVQSRPQP